MGGLQAVPTGFEAILEKPPLITQHFDLVLDILEGVLIPAEPLHLCQCGPIIQHGHCFPEGMKLCCWSSEHVMKPGGHDLDRVKALIVRGGIEVDDVGIFIGLQSGQ